MTIHHQHHHEHTNLAEAVIRPPVPELEKLLLTFCQELVKGTCRKTLTYNNVSVLATAALIDVLGAVEIEARPLPVYITVCNPIMTERLKREPNPTHKEIRHEWIKDGSYCVLHGANENPLGRWYGHVIAIVGNSYVDCAAHVVQLPKKGIRLTSPLHGQPPHHEMGTCNFSGVCNDCLLIYQPHPENRGFEFIADWEDPSRRAPLVQDVLARLREINDAT